MADFELPTNLPIDRVKLKKEIIDALPEKIKDVEIISDNDQGGGPKLVKISLNPESVVTADVLQNIIFAHRVKDVVFEEPEPEVEEKPPLPPEVAAKLPESKPPAAAKKEDAAIKTKVNQHLDNMHGLFSQLTAEYQKLISLGYHEYFDANIPDYSDQFKALQEQIDGLKGVIGVGEAEEGAPESLKEKCKEIEDKLELHKSLMEGLSRQFEALADKVGRLMLGAEIHSTFSWKDEPEISGPSPRPEEPEEPPEQ